MYLWLRSRTRAIISAESAVDVCRKVGDPWGGGKRAEDFEEEDSDFIGMVDDIRGRKVCGRHIKGENNV